MKKIKSILIMLLCLFFVSCEALSSLLLSEVHTEESINNENPGSNNNQVEDNFYFNGTVYSDAYDMFDHGVFSHSGSLDVDFDFPTAYTGYGAEGVNCIRADFSQQGDYGVFNFFTEVGSVDLTAYNSIKFLAKAESDVSIQIGLDSAGGAWNDHNDGVTSTMWIDLSTEWTEYTINLTDLVYYSYTGGANFDFAIFDLSQVTSVFKVDGHSNADIPFYIDHIRYSNEIVDVPVEQPGTANGYTYQIEWGQLSDNYERNAIVVDQNGNEVMYADGSMQLGQVTSSPVTDSYFGDGNALNYVHDGVDAWGGVFVTFSMDNDLTEAQEFKVAIKGNIPPELTCWELNVNGSNDSYQGINFLEYEVESGDAAWRLFVVPTSEFYQVQLDELVAIGLWNPKEGSDIYFEGGYVGCDLIVDLAINFDETIPGLPQPDNDYVFQIEWGQLNGNYENNVGIVDLYGNEVMYAAGSMQLGQVTSTPVSDSFFGEDNALNYVHDGVNSWGGVFFNGVSSYNNVSGATEFKVAVKGYIPPALTCWGLAVEDVYGTRQELNLLQYEVESGDPEWRLFTVPASDYDIVELNAFSGLGLWNPKEGYDLTYEGGYVGCDLIVDVAINGDNIALNPPIPSDNNEYRYQVEWGQLTGEYENNVRIINEYGDDVMYTTGSMQLGQVTSSPVTDSYFGEGNALNYVHDGVDSWGGVFVHGIENNNDLSQVTEFKVAIKGDIPAELTCWGLKIDDASGFGQEINFMEYEVDNGDPEWRLFVVPASEYGLVDLSAFYAMGLWNPKQGLDYTFEGGYVGCDLIIDLAIN